MTAGLDAVVGLDEGRELQAGGNRQWVRIEPGSGAKGFSMLEGEIRVGGGVFPHRHRTYEEAFYVLSGELEFRVGEEHVAGASGASLFVPPGVVHAFRNRSAAPARLLVIHSPASAIGMIDELSAIGAPDPARAAEIMRRHDSESVPTEGWLPTPARPPAGR